MASVIELRSVELLPELLRQVAGSVLGAVRASDTVCRLGGDEFVLLLEELGSAEDQAALYANNVGQKLLEALTVPYALGRGPHHNTPSIGITLFRDHDERVEDILKRADLAMYQSKSAGRNTVRFFDPHMQEVVQRRSELERDLRQALAQGELQLYSQAVVNASGQPTGHEALLRWLHPARGMVSPAEFIPVAEQTGLILAIGDWVMRAACQRLVSWGNNPTTAGWTMAVNLSARQLRQPDFVQRVRAVLADTGANPQLLKLELTESLLLHDVEDTILKMDELARLGIRFSLDDFGTGYSSLNMLKRLPLDQLKIDQSFVRDVMTDPNDAAIAQAVLTLRDYLAAKAMLAGQVVVTADGETRVAKIGDKALATAIKTGNLQQMAQVVTDPSYWSAFLAQAVPSLYMAAKSGGSAFSMNSDTSSGFRRARTLYSVSFWPVPSRVRTRLNPSTGSRMIGP